jgi:hypothetical protein
VILLGGLALLFAAGTAIAAIADALQHRAAPQRDPPPTHVRIVTRPFDWERDA